MNSVSELRVFCGSCLGLLPLILRLNLPLFFLTMKTLLRLATFACLAFASAFNLRAEEPVLRITGPEKTLTFTAAEFAALPHTALTVGDPYNQVPRHFNGVAVNELLTRLGVPLGDKLRGAALQLVVVVRAKDNYSVVFALADFDDQFSQRTLLLADQEAGQPLPEKSGPFQLIAPGDKKAARWVRMVTSIEVFPVVAPPTPSPAPKAKTDPAPRDHSLIPP